MTTVIINEFELVPATPPELTSTTGLAVLDNPATAQAAPSSESRVLETERLIIRQNDRALRLWAH